MAILNIGTPNNFSDIGNVQNYLYQLTDQLRNIFGNLSLDDLGDLTNAINGGYIQPGSIDDNRLKSKFMTTDGFQVNNYSIAELKSSLTALSNTLSGLNSSLNTIGNLLSGDGSQMKISINPNNSVIADKVIKSGMIDTVNSEKILVDAQGGTLDGKLSAIDSALGYLSTQKGVWSPALISRDAVSPTYTVVSSGSTFYRIAGIVFLAVRLQVDITAAGTGYAGVTGLPSGFSPLSPAGLTVTEAYGAVTDAAQCIINPGAGRIDLLKADGTNAQWQAGAGGLAISGWYLIA